MKLATMSTGSDTSLLQEGIFQELKNHGYIGEDNQVLKDFEVHVRKKRSRPVRYCIECGHKFAKGEHGVPMYRYDRDTNTGKDVYYCKKCYAKEYQR